MNNSFNFLFLYRSIAVSAIMVFFYSCSSSQEREKEAERVDNHEVIDTAKEAVEVSKNYPFEYLIGKFIPENDPDFIEIPSIYCSRKGMFMRKEAFASFKKMYEAAKREGIDLKIISAARNFDYQKGIWERKWTGKTLVGGKDLSSVPPKDRALTILKYSSMPGTSRHHWGTDIDLNELNNSYFETGEGLKIYQWLVNNAEKYGFCQPYSEKGAQRPHGYEEEKWHWSYMPLSRNLTMAYKSQVTYEMIKGFQGDETAKEIEVIKKYVLGISDDCIEP